MMSYRLLLRITRICITFPIFIPSKNGLSNDIICIPMCMCIYIIYKLMVILLLDTNHN